MNLERVLIFSITFILALVTIPAPSWAISEDELRIRALEEKVEALYKKGKKIDVPFDAHGVKKQGNIKVGYSKKGFNFKTSDGLFSTNLQWRAQMRFSNPGDGDPDSLSDFSAEETNNFELRRVRMKIGGHGYKQWIKYYFEMDLQPSRTESKDTARSSSRLIDWRITLQPWNELGLRVGQWKINYNRERVDSSGRQTFVERSIVNRVFTIDRQVGAMLQGHFNKGTAADFRYYAGVFNGEGRSVDNEDSDMMWMGRVQWNMFGRDLKWRQSDVSYHKKPTGSLSFAYATHRGVCTRWSSSGCDSLQGFSTSDQHKVDQWQQGFAFKYKGLAIQQEYHEKEVEVNNSGFIHELDGLYTNIGYMLHGIAPSIPEGLELAFRYAYVDAPDPDTITLTNNRDEYTVALNLFMAGHNNKLTLDASLLELEDASDSLNIDDFRVRLQWDISF